MSEECGRLGPHFCNFAFAVPGRSWYRQPTRGFGALRMESTVSGYILEPAQTSSLWI